MPIFVDTGAWYALLDKNDSDHTAAVEFKESLTHSLVTTNYVADEIITLTKNRRGQGIAVEIGGKLWNDSIATLVRVTSHDEKKAWEIFIKHRDKGFSFADCTSFAIMERLRKHGEIYISFALEKSEYYDLMFIMRGPAKKINEKKDWTVGIRSYELLKENVRDCMEAGLLPEISIDVAAFSLWSHAHGITSLIICDRCVMFPEEKLDYIIKGAIDFMISSISKNSQLVETHQKEVTKCQRKKK